MKKELILTFTFLLLISTVLMAQTLEWQWAAQASGTGYDCGRDIAVDEYGNTYVTGFFSDTAIFGLHTLTSDGYFDIFVAKMDATGNWLWATKAGGDNFDGGLGIAIHNGYCYVSGAFVNSATFGPYSLISNGDDDVFVAKIDTNGNWLWVIQAGGSNVDGSNDIVVDENSNCYVTGMFKDTATFGSHSLSSNGEFDIFVAKADANGNWLWATKAGGSSIDYSEAIGIDDYGNSYVTGNFYESATFGSYSLTSNEYFDVFIAKLDADGNWLWATHAGGCGNDRSYAIAIDENSNSYVAGNFYGSATFGDNTVISIGDADIFISKMDTDGNWLWATNAGGSSNDVGRAIAIDDYDNCYIGGHFQETVTFGSHSLVSAGESDVYVAKLNANGNWLWARKAGGNSEDCCYAVAIDDNGNSYSTGFFSGIATFGSYTLTSTNTWDRNVFVAKLGYDTSVDNHVIPINIKLSNYPNPFNPSTTIEFSMQNDSNVELNIFNIRGQKIKTLTHNEFTKGDHSVIWNGDDESNNPVSSGIYYYILKINDNAEAVKKCLLLK